MDNLINASAEFKLKPMYEALNNVAIDNGYADHKVAFWANSVDGKKVIGLISYPARAQMGAINISLSGSTSGVYDVGHEQEAWTVGKEVSEPEVVRGTRYAHSDLNTLLVKHSLQVSGFSGKKVRISTGLPYAHYFKDGEKNDQFLEKVKNSLETVVAPRNGEAIAEIKEHLIYPESTAAFLDYAVDHETGEMNVEIENGVVVVDIGGNTTDISSITPEYRIDDNKSGSKKVGVLDVRDELRKLILEEFKIDSIRDSQLDQAIRTSKCSIFGQKEDISSLLLKSKKMVSKKINDFVYDLIGDAAAVDKIIYVGGGAAVLEDVIKEYPHAHVPDAPEFANARGMLLNSTFVNTASE